MVRTRSRHELLAVAWSEEQVALIAVEKSRRDILAFFEDAGWDNDRMLEACRCIVELGDTVDEYADKLMEMQELEALMEEEEEE